jgi:hypothetical protein
MPSSLSLDRLVYENSARRASLSGQKINKPCKGLIGRLLWSKCAAMCTGLSTETGDSLGNAKNRYERGGCGRSPWRTRCASYIPSVTSSKQLQWSGITDLHSGSTPTPPDLGIGTSMSGTHRSKSWSLSCRTRNSESRKHRRAPWPFACALQLPSQPFMNILQTCRQLRSVSF